MITTKMMTITDRDRIRELLAEAQTEKHTLLYDLPFFEQSVEKSYNDKTNARLNKEILTASLEVAKSILSSNKIESCKASDSIEDMLNSINKELEYINIVIDYHETRYEKALTRLDELEMEIPLLKEMADIAEKEVGEI